MAQKHKRPELENDSFEKVIYYAIGFADNTSLCHSNFKITLMNAHNYGG